ncbi:MAG: radical SAM protein, partial [Candidatus Kariarchaeaceae archaeon]
GRISSMSDNPMEKKPFFHFFPGSYSTTIGTFSCNFTCPWCHNNSISKVAPRDRRNFKQARFISPDQLVQLTCDNDRVSGLCFSFNEPTLMLEYTLDTIGNANRKGLHTSFVTNGYMTPQALELLIGAGLDAMTVTIKGSSEIQKQYTGSNVKLVWKNLETAIKKGVHVEVVYLVVTSVNDSPYEIEKVVEQFVERLTNDTPLHFTRYFPDYKFYEPQTPIQTLETAHAIAKEKELNYVYLGNIFTHRLENTFCPECNNIVIERLGYSITNLLGQNNECLNCGFEIPIRNEIRRERS